MKIYTSSLGIVLVGLLLLQSCSSDDPNNETLSISFNAFPSLNASGRPLLIISQSPLGNNPQISFNQFPAPIDTIVPSQDSLIVIVPASLSIGTVDLNVETETQNGSIEYKIVSESFFNNLPVGSPTFVFPGTGSIGTGLISQDDSIHVDVVNLYDPEHEMKIQGIDFSPGNPNCKDTVNCCRFSYEIFNGNSNCMSVNWSTIDGACDFPDTRIDKLSISRSTSEDSDEFSGIFFSSSTIDIPADINAKIKYEGERAFLLLSSLKDGRQYLFVVIRGVEDPSNLDC